MIETRGALHVSRRIEELDELYLSGWCVLQEVFDGEAQLLQLALQDFSTHVTLGVVIRGAQGATCEGRSKRNLFLALAEERKPSRAGSLRPMATRMPMLMPWRHRESKRANVICKYFSLSVHTCMRRPSVFLQVCLCDNFASRLSVLHSLAFPNVAAWHDASSET